MYRINGLLSLVLIVTYFVLVSLSPIAKYDIKTRVNMDCEIGELTVPSAIVEVQEPFTFVVEGSSVPDGFVVFVEIGDKVFGSISDNQGNWRIQINTLMIEDNVSMAYFSVNEEPKVPLFVIIVNRVTKEQKSSPLFIPECKIKMISGKVTDFEPYNYDCEGIVGYCESGVRCGTCGCAESIYSTDFWGKTPYYSRSSLYCVQIK